MITGKNIIGYELSSLGSNTAHSYNAISGQSLSGDFVEANSAEIELAMRKSQSAFLQFKNTSGKQRALFLRAIVEEITALGDDLIQRCMAETGLPEARFKGERARTIFQLQSFADLLDEGSWVEARIDTAMPERKPLPRVDLRKMLIPLGPVVVFTASNFPLAYSTAGVDTASALASGCPVLVKNHPAHFGAGEMVGQAIMKAAKRCGMPDGVFSLLNGVDFKVGETLVKHPLTKAVGFTGSFIGGKAIYDMAQSRETPIPVFAEMGSTNPVLLLPEALRNAAEKIGKDYASSINLGVGQFCTNPGLLLGIEGEDLDRFTESIKEGIAQAKPFTMLHKGIKTNYDKLRNETIADESVRLESESTLEADLHKSEARPTVVSVLAANFLQNPTMHKEVFGPFSMLVKCANADELHQVVESVQGQLTSTLMAHGNDYTNFANTINILKEKAGRLVFNAVPTGVEVCPAMHHGGPFPATTDSRFSSVGADAIKRFARPISFQDCPVEILPEELKDENSLGIWRLLNNKWTNG
jgi:NADP-dependent aldehyde dehydrogenase